LPKRIKGEEVIFFGQEERVLKSSVENEIGLYEASIKKNIIPFSLYSQGTPYKLKE
jgi:hypothetical protein